MKKKTVAKRVTKTNSKSVWHQPVKNTHVWLVAGLMIVLIGGAFFIKNSLVKTADIFVVGQPTQGSNVYKDMFDDGELDREKWTINKTKYVSINETKQKNVEVKFAEGVGVTIAPATTISQNIWGAFDYSMKVAKERNFSLIVQMPKLEMGEVGTLFAGSTVTFKNGGKIELFRTHSDNQNYIKYWVNDKSGLLKERAVANNDELVQLRIERVALTGKNQLFKLMFKPIKADRDYEWITLDEYTTDKLYDDTSRIFLSANSYLVNGKYRAGTAKFDMFNLSVSNGEKKLSFEDDFNSDTRNPLWKDDRTSVTSADPMPSLVGGSFLMSIESGKNGDGKSKVARVYLDQTFETNQDASTTVILRKPIVEPSTTGNIGTVNITYKETDGDYCTASWKGDTLVFTSSADVTVDKPIKLKSDVAAVQVKISRGTGHCIAEYKKVGEDDFNYKIFGDAITKKGSRLGSPAKLYLSVSNTGEGNKYPKVTGIIDKVTIISDAVEK